MAASRFSSDVLEMFYGPISQEENARLQPPLRPSRDFDFRLVRNNFIERLRIWRKTVPVAYIFKTNLLKFAQKTKEKLKEVVKYKIQNLSSVKTQFALNVRFSITRDGQKQEMEH